MMVMFLVEREVKMCSDSPIAVSKIAENQSSFLGIRKSVPFWRKFFSSSSSSSSSLDWIKLCFLLQMRNILHSFSLPLFKAVPQFSCILYLGFGALFSLLIFIFLLPFVFNFFYLEKGVGIREIWFCRYYVR